MDAHREEMFSFNFQVTWTIVKVKLLVATHLLIIKNLFCLIITKSGPVVTSREEIALLIFMLYNQKIDQGQTADFHPI